MARGMFAGHMSGRHMANGDLPKVNMPAGWIIARVKITSVLK